MNKNNEYKLAIVFHESVQKDILNLIVSKLKAMGIKSHYTKINKDK